MSATERSAQWFYIDRHILDSRCISYWLEITSTSELRSAIEGSCGFLSRPFVAGKKSGVGHLSFCPALQLCSQILRVYIWILFVGRATRLLGFAESTDTVRDAVQLISSQEFVLGRRISIEWFAPSARSHQGWRCWTAREKLEISWELMRQRTHLDWLFQYHFYFDYMYCECIGFCSHFKYNKASL